MGAVAPRFRLVIDFESPAEAEAAYIATLVFIYMRQLLLKEDSSPERATLHGVRELGGDGDEGH